MIIIRYLFCFSLGDTSIFLCRNQENCIKQLTLFSDCFVKEFAYLYFSDVEKDQDLYCLKKDLNVFKMVFENVTTDCEHDSVSLTLDSKFRKARFVLGR